MTEPRLNTAEELSVVKKFNEHGTLMYTRAQIPFSEHEWQQLEALLKNLSYDRVVGGDAAEAHAVNVCRFYNDVEKPVALHPRSAELQALVMSPKMRTFYRRFTGTDQLCLRRCQANLMQPGDFIGVHKDQDSNPDYLATVVFHFSNDYQGGDFVTHDSHAGTEHYHPRAHSMLVNSCIIPHEVEAVQTGQRLTLACFLSAEFGASGNPRKDFKLQ